MERAAMQYREIGKTGMKASVIGLGGEHLDHKPYEKADQVIGAALEHGINIIDVFMPGQEVRQNISKALKGRRDKVLLQGHIGSVDKDGQYDISRDLATCQKNFENYLTEFQTDYIDLGMLFFIDSEDDYKNVFETGIVEYALKLKQQGTIRAIGASSHNPVMARKAIETGVVETMLFSINPAFDLFPVDKNVLAELDGGLDSSKFVGVDPQRAALYQLCEREDVGITVMKTLGAGKLLSAEHTPFAKPLTMGQCIHYALTRPAVASVLLGCSEPEQVEEAIGYLSLSDEERDYTAAISAFQSDFSKNCVYCSHCQPCPVEIDIATVTKYLDIAKLDEGNIPPSIRQHYGHLAHKGSECIACGSCQERCPFGVKIIDNMSHAARLFE